MNNKESIHCDNCYCITEVELIERHDPADDVLFCPVCGEELFTFDDDEDEIESLDLDD